MLDHIITLLYIAALIGLSIYGLQALLMSLLFLFTRKRNPPLPPDPIVWPTVTVQLPIYNEKYVIERLIDRVCQLDYPANKLSIQVLDDSTDETTCLVADKVKDYRRRGVNISLNHRQNRTGYKAGALADALPRAQGELIAILDADFLPTRDFLKKTVPYLAANPHLGLAQARWGHLNASYNLLTRGQALFIDGHFIIEQTARSRSGLLFNFNGSGGVWRKACIIDSGGWHSDTLAEDLDLSYRAQLRGWQISYLPDVVVPAEIPPQIAAFKKQQYRWARGAIQVLRKQIRALYSSNRLSIQQKIMAVIHLSGYITHPLMLIFVLSSLWVVMNKGHGLPYLPWLPLAGLGGPLLFGLSQASEYRDWHRRLLGLPVLLGLGIGIAYNNSRAVIAGFSHKSGVFERTPKFHLESRRDGWQANKYRLKLDYDILAELSLGVYSAVTLYLAVREFPPLVPALIMFTLSFLYTGLTGLLQSVRGNWAGQTRSIAPVYSTPFVAPLPPTLMQFKNPIN
jgi:cellulose synthase/poly-beta-1,6-N-acetylglucosamine synthase-like glycosyltransferase